MTHFGSFFCVLSLMHAIIDANIISPLIELLQHAEFDIKREAAWAISNVTCGVPLNRSN